MSVRDELEFVAQTAGDNPKNYQMWFHRRELCADDCELLPSEVKYTSLVLGRDPKNYHAWSHRQWAIEKMGTFSEDADFVENMLQQDARNNSAWNHKWFLATLGCSRAWSEEAILDQIDTCQHFFKQILHNEAAWNFFIALIQQPAAKTEIVLAAAHATVQAACDDAQQPQTPQRSSNSTFPLAAKLDVLELKLAITGQQPGTDYIQVCDALIASDPIRSAYWQHRKKVASDSA